MGEEEAPHSIVRVCICLRELVMDTVVPGPLIDVILQGKMSRNLGLRLEMLPSKLQKGLQNPVDVNVY